MSEVVEDVESEDEEEEGEGEGEGEEDGPWSVRSSLLLSVVFVSLLFIFAYFRFAICIVDATGPDPREHLMDL